MEQRAQFALPAPIVVPPRSLHRLSLTAVGERRSDVSLSGNGIVFDADGWFEVLLSVSWDPASSLGHRFAHTAIPDAHPLHSEAIEAAVLNEISEGRQLLRGNTWFGPAGVSTISLEVWHDCPDAVRVLAASLEIRPLALAEAGRGHPG